MKQKLLNLITWRATLLVAFLCCTFSSAWADWKNVNNLETKTLTFTDNSTSVTSDGITWTISSNVSLKYDDSAIYVQKTKGTDIQYISLTTSTNPSGNPIIGTITKITVNCKSSNNLPINVSFNNQSFGSTGSTGSPSSNYANHEFTGVAYCNQNQISVTIGTSGTSIKNGTIYVKSIAITYMPCASIPIKSACYDKEETNKIYGTYSNQEAFVVPSDLTVAKVNVTSGTLEVTPYTTGAIVPANTGVMVSCKSEVDVNKSIFLDPSTTAPDTQKNMLRPTGDGIDNENTVMSGPDPDETYKFYYLTMNGDQIGFYRRNDTGAAFPMNVPNKAYLAVPEGEVEPKTEGNEGDVKGFVFGDGTNGIKAVETTETESKAIYNLAGQRVSKMQKGIYVVNGKKVLVK